MDPIHAFRDLSIFFPIVPNLLNATLLPLEHRGSDSH